MSRTKQTGAVSIFIVIFTALLVTVVTTSFIQIMMRNQQQASNNDLSQSAYDSALAGVEDAKRALIRLRDCQNSGDAACVSTVQSGLDSQECNTLETTGVVAFENGKEVTVGDEALNQAYTCVKVQTRTPNYQGTLSDDDDSSVIELKGVSAFNQIRFSWYNEADHGDGATIGYLDPVNYPLKALPTKGDWPATMPPIMRLQLMQFERGNLSLSGFNGGNARTLFAYPGGTSDPQTGDFNNDTRRTNNAGNVPELYYCSTAADQNGGYYCAVTINLPAQVSREAYLQVAAIYNKTHYQIELLNSGVLVDFDGVQPIVDATGRASDLFRRVKARISVSGSGASLQFPNAALSIGKNLCKDFYVTNDPADYQSPTGAESCDPNPVAP